MALRGANEVIVVLHVHVVLYNLVVEPQLLVEVEHARLEVVQLAHHQRMGLIELALQLVSGSGKESRSGSGRSTRGLVRRARAFCCLSAFTFALCSSDPTKSCALLRTRGTSALF